MKRGRLEHAEHGMGAQLGPGGGRRSEPAKKASQLTRAGQGVVPLLAQSADLLGLRCPQGVIGRGRQRPAVDTLALAAVPARLTSLAEVLQQMPGQAAVVLGEADYPMNAVYVALLALAEPPGEALAQRRRVRRGLPQAIALPNARGLNVNCPFVLGLTELRVPA